MWGRALKGFSILNIEELGMWPANKISLRGRVQIVRIFLRLMLLVLVRRARRSYGKRKTTPARTI